VSKCDDYRPDHNGECLNCDEPADAHHAPVDGSRPATREQWFCPSCGTSCPAFVSFRRIIACVRCRWLFAVSLRRSILDRSLDPEEVARLEAEQGEP